MLHNDIKELYIHLIISIDRSADFCSHCENRDKVELSDACVTTAATKIYDAHY